MYKIGRQKFNRKSLPAQCLGHKICSEKLRTKYNKENLTTINLLFRGGGLTAIVCQASPGCQR